MHFELWCELCRLMLRPEARMLAGVWRVPCGFGSGSQCHVPSLSWLACTSILGDLGGPIYGEGLKGKTFGLTRP